MEDNEDNKITLVSLLFESILSIFLLGSAPSEKIKNYSIGEKWKIWIQNKFNFNIQTDKYKKIIYRLVIIFLWLNLMVFIPTVLGALRSSKYPVARAYLQSARTIDLMYVIPLSNVFGYNSWIVKPFDYIKNGLYNNGISKIPLNEGEREIWWLNIKFLEFKSIISPFLEKVYLSGDKDHPSIKLTPSQIQYLNDWNNELYSHILTLPKSKISDSKYGKQKLYKFIILANSYLDFNYTLGMKLQFTRLENKKTDSNNDWILLGPTQEYVKNNMAIIDIFNKFVSYSKKNDLESYNYYKNNINYKDIALLDKAALYLLQSERQYKTLSCKMPEVNILAVNNKKLREYLLTHYSNNMDFSEYADITLLIDKKIQLPQCSNIPIVEDYRKFIKRIDTPIFNTQMYLNLLK